MNVRRKRELLIHRDGAYCHYCGVRLITPEKWNVVQSMSSPPDGYRRAMRAVRRGARPATIDHKIPVYHGGTKDLENLVLACPECNKEKGTRDYLEFVCFKLSRLPCRCIVLAVLILTNAYNPGMTS